MDSKCLLVRFKREDGRGSIALYILSDVKLSECHLTHSKFSAPSLTLHKTLIDDFIPHKNIITSFKESL